MASTDPAPNPNPTSYSTWLPDIKWTTFIACTFAANFLLAGISSWFHIDIAAWLQPVINDTAHTFGIKEAPGAQSILALVIGAAISWWKKAPYRDIVKHFTPALLRRAARDPNVNILEPSTVQPNAIVVTPVPPT